MSTKSCSWRREFWINNWCFFSLNAQWIFCIINKWATFYLSGETSLGAHETSFLYHHVHLRANQLIALCSVGQEKWFKQMIIASKCQPQVLRGPQSDDVLWHFLKLHTKKSGTLFSGRWVLYTCIGSHLVLWNSHFVLQSGLQMRDSRRSSFPPRHSAHRWVHSFALL